MHGAKYPLWSSTDGNCDTLLTLCLSFVGVSCYRITIFFAGQLSFFCCAYKMTYNNYNGDDNTTNLGSTSQKCSCAPRGSTRVKESSPMSLILGTVCNTLCVTASILLGVIDSFNTQRQMPVEHFSRPMSEWIHPSSNLFEPTIKLRNCQTKLKTTRSFQN